MEINPLLIEQLPEQQILREDDHLLRTSCYFQIHPCNFKFSQYDHGTPEMKEKYHITKLLFRYFNKRNFLFSRFEQGIAIDEESWYSVIPEAVSHYLRQRFKSIGVKKIFEPFSGVGGIAIHLCDHFEEYIVNDIDPNKLKMLQHNMKIYNKSLNRLKYINKDFLEI
jgi:tRNA G26 N,N-dimethylase Trm1